MSDVTHIAGSIQIDRVTSPAQRRAFLNLPYDLYEDDPNWRAPLRFERAAQLSAKSNPSARQVDGNLYLARRGEEVVGRIAAFTYAPHDAHSGDARGFFGYFDCIPDVEVSSALLETAKADLRDRGRTDIVGPMMWGVNEECGMLVDGFDTPPVVMMPYGRPDYPRAMEAAGFSKAIDLYAYQAELAAGYPRPRFTASLVKLAERDPKITWRPLGNFKADVDTALELFNDAWSQNWGFVPFSHEQFTHMAKEMKPIMFKDGFWMGEIDGEPAAFIWMIPDVNELTAGFNGRLLPFNWAKFLYRLKGKPTKQARIPLMGLRLKHHATRRGLALIAALCEAVFEGARNNGFTHCELSWILEGNDAMIGICEQASAERYKTYRMYQAEL